MLKEGEIRIPSGCAIAAIIDRKGKPVNGSEIIKSIALMHASDARPFQRVGRRFCGVRNISRA